MSKPEMRYCELCKHCPELEKARRDFAKELLAYFKRCVRESKKRTPTRPLTEFTYFEIVNILEDKLKGLEA